VPWKYSGLLLFVYYQACGAGVRSR
jgi:hypothetical protein